MIGLQIKVVFEPAGPATGEICCKCNTEIKGQKYQGVLQFGFIEQLSLSPLKMFMCEECRIKHGPNP